MNLHIKILIIYLIGSISIISYYAIKTAIELKELKLLLINVFLSWFGIIFNTLIIILEFINKYIIKKILFENNFKEYYKQRILGIVFLEKKEDTLKRYCFLKMKKRNYFKNEKKRKIIKTTIEKFSKLYSKERKWIK